jgi:AcrR family transcriptional regulator
MVATCGPRRGLGETSTEASTVTRVQQREATRQRIVDCAVEVLISRGLAAVTTAGVQREAGVSRGALLHHFPTRQEMLGATIAGLMTRNEAAAGEATAALAPYGAARAADPVTRAMQVLQATVVRPAFGAELELWAAARTDPALREVLRREERLARADLYRTVANVFGPELTARPRYRVAASLTVQFLRGLAISEVLRAEQNATDRLIEEWAAVVRSVLSDEPGTTNRRRP